MTKMSDDCPPHPVNLESWSVVGGRILHRGEAISITQDQPHDLVFEFEGGDGEIKFRCGGVFCAICVQVLLFSGSLNAAELGISDRDWGKFCGIIEYSDGSFISNIRNNNMTGMMYRKSKLFVYVNNIEDVMWIVAAHSGRIE